ncbi:hypothetical protein [Amycolatopsis sp. DSM 110486]|uniref:hypothetical protein n=1 Tax=Amycolatopsis sp. DSM 110486 TaxID=2865832 RepID=UPI001C69CED1|nr:hypothetical protein [Amycolatopsis sp. DSM 110486]QYN17609.1 hypothetical protein K1T34_33020 [Amycolatopsis sp. DSM 110486]
MPILDGGRWYNLDCLCGNTHRCSCTEVCEIELPGWLPEPVRVEIDGRDIPLIEFRVDNGRRLVWEGGDCFPLCQDLSKRLGEPGTWAVEFKSGLPVPAGGDTAASDLACELLKACNPAHSEGCKLPDNVRSVTRQGVTIDFDTTVAASGKFNVPSVDLWVQAANPTGLLRPVEVYSPDVPHPVVTTWGR